MSNKLKHEGISDLILKAYYKVYNVFGYGFLEKIYEKALLIELRKSGLKCVSQHPIKVFYEGEVIGNYIADIIVEDKILLELKSIKTLTIQDESQLLNYLSCTEFEVGLLLNFGPKPQTRRKIFDNERKAYIRAIREDQ
ncbi:MAG: GxxExxY protein [Candidatus Cloacimonetes bacterium]|nr:GxxExxY protein [Candidatus Cloacimonadota bacterium]MCF7813078.1 GxxExxY protein [Candidatus Cloacimonadota bacterium]MCF7867181.1 GxxExxY protein [Candidatus Cloacimonadota bacterium]MCF7882625.1 GxxExxY protein [Candidatus Cloacimonadota bacterium]